MKKILFQKKYQIIIVLLVIIIVLVALFYLLDRDKYSIQNQEAVLSEVNQLYESGNADAATVLLERYHKNNPEDKDVASKLAYYYYQQKRYDDFLTIFQENELESASSINMAASIYQSRGELEKSQELFDRLIVLFPKNPQIYINYASFYQSLGKNVEALEVVERGLAVSPNSTRLLITASSVALKTGDKQGAIDYANRVLLIDDDNSQAKNILATVEG